MSAVDYISKNQFVWWQGVVEDVHDPMKIGRVRVRVVGYHNPNKEDLPTNDLPWALPIMPITSASITGIGSSCTGLVPGSVVIGFFRDGQLAQQPIIFGSIPGAPLEGPPGSSYGYGDPRLTTATGGLYMPNENELGKCGSVGKYAPRSGHYVGPTFDPELSKILFGRDDLPSVGGIAKYEYNFFTKGITHENSFYGNIYPRYWGGPTGSISPITDTNTLAGGCGPTHGSVILQKYIIDRASLGTILPVPKFRPYYELPLITYDVAELLAQGENPSMMTEEGIKKLDLGAGGGFRTGANLFGKYGGMPPSVDENGNTVTPAPFNGYETTTSLRGNEFFERIFGATTDYVSTKIDSNGNRVFVVDEDNPWVFVEPKGTTHTRQYPYNHVYESESGHIMEFDDTNGGERIKIAHRLGTSEEIIEDGSKIEQIINDKYTRILGDNNTVVGGNSIFFGERGFRAIINAEALYYSPEVSKGRPAPQIQGGSGDKFVYGPGFIGTGEVGGAGWWNESNKEHNLPDGKELGTSEFFIDPIRERDIFHGNYKIQLPGGVNLDKDVKFYSGYRGLPRMNFFKGGNTDIIVAYGNVNLHVMRGNANVRIDDGDMNLEVLKGDLRSYIGGNHFQRIDGSEIRYIGGNKYDIVQGKIKDIANGEEITTRGAISLLNSYVSLDFTLRAPGGDSPLTTPGSQGPIQGMQNSQGRSEQEFRGLIEEQRFNRDQQNVIGLF